MHPKILTLLRGFAALSLLALTAYWHWSPYLALYALQRAASEQSLDAFNEVADYAKLRESFKTQFSGVVQGQLSAIERTGGDFLAVRALLGSALVDQMLDAVVRPDVLLRTIQTSQLSVKSPLSGDAGIGPVKPGAGLAQWGYERTGADELRAYILPPHAAPQADRVRLGLVLQRRGFATWSLTEVRLPSLLEGVR